MLHRLGGERFRQAGIAILILATTAATRNVYAQSSTLNSVMAGYSKAPDCDDNHSVPPWMGVSLTVVTQGFGSGRGAAIDRCLAKKTTFKRTGHATGPVYYEFSSAGSLDLDGGPHADFTLTLAQPLIRLRGSQPSLGRLAISFADGREKVLPLTGDIHISSNGRLIQGALESGETAVVIVVHTCSLEGCTP
jgi:hypothetical protein